MNGVRLQSQDRVFYIYLPPTHIQSLPLSLLLLLALSHLFLPHLSHLSLKSLSLSIISLNVYVSISVSLCFYCVMMYSEAQHQIPTLADGNA